jgi:hypothetical protein
MSTARLNVWVTQVGKPCRIDSERTWFVHILHCNGEILEWCGRRYVNLKTECGHLDVEIPPGCYTVVATWSPSHDPNNVPTSLGNHISHLSIVRANCGDHVCVTLFPPTFHFCGIWWLTAVADAVKMDALPREVADRAREAVEAALEATEQRIDPFTTTMQKSLRQAEDEATS